MHHRTQLSFVRIASGAFALASLSACSDSSTASPTPATVKDTGTTITACQKYGGASVIDTVVQKSLVTKLAGDCRISKHFTDLVVGNDASRLTHVSECLSTQVQELFGCAGVTYAGSKDKAGVVCRDMTAAHAGLKIASKDFDALIEDTVATLTEAGVSQEDIGAVAPTLTSTGLKAAVITTPAANCNVKPVTAGTEGAKCAAGGANPTTTCPTN